MNIKKEFVPYEIALKLEEIGFDEPFITFDTQYLYRNGDFCRSNSGAITMFESFNDELVIAPLFQQAFRWLKEKYGLHRHICYFNDTNVWHGDIYKIQNEGLMNNPMELTNYKTYEEAELACLNKLIKIIKNEKLTL
jgi:hypothetical protein